MQIKRVSKINRNDNDNKINTVKTTTQQHIHVHFQLACLMPIKPIFHLPEVEQAFCLLWSGFLFVCDRIQMFFFAVCNLSV